MKQKSMKQVENRKGVFLKHKVKGFKKWRQKKTYLLCIRVKLE